MGLNLYFSLWLKFKLIQGQMNLDNPNFTSLLPTIADKFKMAGEKERNEYHVWSNIWGGPAVFEGF